ncbi:MAG: TIGR02757 family protein [Nitrospinae bacterium]|nr:TIGR02757 family protein [Nitrospinota bacterium]
MPRAVPFAGRRAGPAALKPYLDRLRARFDISMLEPDPLAATRGYADPGDLETALLFAALFAYGRADLIQKTVTRILASMGESPARFCENIARRPAPGWMRGFVYRFHRQADLAALARAVGKARNEHGSLRALFLAHDDPNAETPLPGLTGMARALRRYAKRDTTAFRTLLSDPSGGGASKRWMLYLRWMVRKDGVDPGPWHGAISTARLVIPLDTHVARVARRLGILNRAAADWKSALEVTRFLRQLEPADPVSYDFALCSFGKLGYCVAQVNKNRCQRCDLAQVCLR